MFQRESPRFSRTDTAPRRHKSELFVRADIFCLDDPFKDLARGGRRHDTAVIGTLRLVDDDEREIARLVGGEKAEERGDIFPLSDGAVFKFLRGARLSAHPIALDVGAAAAPVFHYTFQKGGKDAGSLLTDRAVF